MRSKCRVTLKHYIMSLNKVMLIGNVGSDPEVRYLENNPQNPGANVKVATIRLATTERYRDRNGEQRENTEWHPNLYRRQTPHPTVDRPDGQQAVHHRSRS